MIRAVGKSGSARSALEVTIEPASSAVTCLESALHASGGVTFNSGASLLRSGALTTNLAGSPYLASPAKTMPGNDVFD